MAQGEPEADGLGLGAVGGQLAGHVVDGGDVIGVESVPQPEHVGADTESDREHLRADLIVLRYDQHGQGAESDHVQNSNDAE